MDNLASPQSMSICRDSLVSYIPRQGKEFESEQDAYEFYTQYGWKTGFSIRREYGNRSRKTDQITSRKFTCSKEGFRGHDKRQEKVKHPKCPRPETRTGCLAHMTIKLNKTNGKYLICSFQAEHNHPLHISPCAHMMRPQRKMSDALAAEGLPAADSSLCKQDHRNHLSTKRQRDMKYGEAGCLLKYFQAQSMENPSFYYAVQLDADEKIANVFWTDPRMIINYGQFGDVVSFETKFRNTKELRPFASFVGVNHHRETIVFGAALLYDETTESFRWLFETFLEAMSGKKPKTMFTDQDDAISEAICLVMPETYHRFCISHLKQNAAKNLGHLFKGESDFKKEFKACINEYEEVDEFLHAWDTMLDKHNVRGNSWLQQMYEVKEKWARPYIKYSFSAGIRSSKLSESLNSNLRLYLTSDMDLVQFFMHFERVFNDNWYKELEAEYNYGEKLSKFKIKAPMLMQTAAIYTNNIFQLFQTEYEEFQSAYITYRNETSTIHEYLVAICDQPKVYKVIGDPLEQTVSCICRKFETHGYLCSHAVKAFDAMDIKYLPSNYILRRWSKGARDEIMKDQNGQDIQLTTKMKVSMRYRYLCPKYVRLVSRASESEEAYKFLDQCSADLNMKVEELIQKDKCFDEATAESHDPLSLSTSNHRDEVEKDENSEFTRMKGHKKNSTSKLLGKTNDGSHSFLSGHTSPQGMERPSETPPIGVIIHYPAYQTSVGTISYPNSSAWMNYGVVRQRGNPMFTQFLGESAVCSSFQSAQALNTSECTQDYLQPIDWNTHEFAVGLNALVINCFNQGHPMFSGNALRLLIVNDVCMPNPLATYGPALYPLNMKSRSGYDEGENDPRKCHVLQLEDGIREQNWLPKRHSYNFTILNRKIPDMNSSSCLPTCICSICRQPLVVKLQLQLRLHAGIRPSTQGLQKCQGLWINTRESEAISVRVVQGSSHGVVITLIVRHEHYTLKPYM